MKKYIILILALILIGCAESPIKIIREAQTAKIINRCNGENYLEGVKLFEKGLNLVKQEELKFALFRNYAKAESTFYKSIALMESEEQDEPNPSTPTKNYTIQTFKLDELQFERLIEVLKRY